MERKVCAAAVQFNIALGEVETNLAHVREQLSALKSKDCHLAVLPEMWSTGYDYKRLGDLSEQTPRICQVLAEMSAELGIVIVGSLPDKRDGTIYNTAFVMDGGETVGSYSKLHLFSTMGEDRYLGAGDKTLVVQTSVGRIGVAICYDLRFPELFRKLALDGAEILCIPAEWPHPRGEHWRTLLRARAIENQMPVVAANCCGVQGKLDFAGMSMVISPWGDILAEAKGQTDTPLAILDFKQMEDYRFRINCFRDRRPEIYGTLP
ncbi:MAG: carbon-nitrogen family hydrolase [Desulfuromonadales bacterium]|nr:carbon-nitrogen family hydrolase [Desulfuromonadales bacterium]NIR33258.1 carbon-nitrogen family hydrolase [Desulfuromonadales bacterium]NIS43477.1 carbon-nitrogen family hydrolase [Desulfuromonadales bacterium]